MATDVWAVVTTLGTVLAGIVALIALIVSMVLRDGTRQAKLDAAEARRLAERSAAAAEASAEAARRGAQESQRSNQLLEADLIRRAQARDAARYRWSVACIPTNRTGISRFHLLNTGTDSAHDVVLSDPTGGPAYQDLPSGITVHPGQPEEFTSRSSHDYDIPRRLVLTFAESSEPVEMMAVPRHFPRVDRPGWREQSDLG